MIPRSVYPVCSDCPSLVERSETPGMVLFPAFFVRE